MKDLTLDEIKEAIPFDESTSTYKALIGLIDCWYAIEKQNGKTEEEALTTTLNKFIEKILQITPRNWI